MNVDEWSNWFALVRYNKTEKSFPKRRPIDHTATPLKNGLETLTNNDIFFAHSVRVNFFVD